MSYNIPFTPQQKVLEIGGGDNPLFHPNMDKRKLPQVDIVADLEKRWPISDASYEGVFGKFILEHISWRKIPHFLLEIHRVLLPDGKVILIAPNTLEQCKEITKRNKISIEENAMLYGGQEGTTEETENYHKAAFSFDYIQALLTEAGFTDIVLKPLHPSVITDMFIEAKKGAPKNLSAAITQASWYKELSEDLQGIQTEDICLNIGSFTVMIDPPFLNLDKLDMTGYAKEHGFLFKQVDVRYGLPFKDKSVAIINSSHMIEHITVPEGRAFLKECRRVIKDDGWIRISTPDLDVLILAYHQNDMSRFDEHQTEEYKDSPSQADKFWRILTPGHKTIYDEVALCKLLRESSFQPKQAKYNKKYDMYPDHTLYVSGFPIEVKTPKLKPLKIAIVSTPFIRTPPDAYGGLEQIVADLAEALAAKGHDVTVFAADGSNVPGCKIVEFGPPTKTVNVNWLEAERKAYEASKDNLDKFDIIHEHNWFGHAYLMKVLNPSLLVMHTHHGGLNWKSRPPNITRLNLVAISDWMTRVYTSQGFIAKRCYNGINLDRYPFKAEKGDRLLYVGRFSKIKQPHVALEVAKRLDIGIDLVGGTFVDDVNYLNEIRAMVKAYPKAKMYEDASHEVKLELMQNAKCFLFPSAMGEPFGLVAIEALGCGTPVIASKDGAIPELVTPEVGIVCDSINPPQIIEDMMNAVKKIDTIKPEDCRKRAEKFSREQMADAYLKLYREILNGNEW